MFQGWKIAGKIPVRGISCCPHSDNYKDVVFTSLGFLESLDELISILLRIFSENGDITKKDKNFLASAELVKKVLSRARINKRTIRFSLPKKICKKIPILSAHCAVELTPGNPTKLYNKWVS